MPAFRLQKSEIKREKNGKSWRGKETTQSKGEALYREGIAICVRCTGQSLLINPGIKQAQEEKTHSQVVSYQASAAQDSCSKLSFQGLAQEHLGWSLTQRCAT